MTLKLLVTLGCSMTFGDELDHPEIDAWPAVLGAQLGVETLNWGACAGSNRRTVRLAVTEVTRAGVNRRLAPDEVLVLCMWTRLNRFEVHSTARDRYGGLPPGWGDDRWCRIHPAYISRGDTRSLRWYKHLHDEDGDKATFLTDWTMFDAWLRSSGLHFGYLWAFEPHAGLFDGYDELRDRIERSCSLLGIDGSAVGGPSIYGYGSELGDLGSGGHPLERTHAQFVTEHVGPWVTREVLR